MTRQAWTDELNAYLLRNRTVAPTVPYRYVPLSPPVVCNDGFSMSVQASWSAYCEPRSDIGPWTAVEVGMPSSIEPLLWDYAEASGFWTNTVYPYTPIEVVGAVIELHGGADMLRHKE